jgi:hypothetical protein
MFEKKKKVEELQLAKAKRISKKLKINRFIDAFCRNFLFHKQRRLESGTIQSKRIKRT